MPPAPSVPRRRDLVDRCEAEERGHRPHDVLRTLDDVLVGEADHTGPLREEAGIALGVGLTLPPGGVGGVPVDLDDEVMLVVGGVR